MLEAQYNEKYCASIVIFIVKYKVYVTFFFGFKIFYLFFLQRQLEE